MFICHCFFCTFVERGDTVLYHQKQKIKIFQIARVMRTSQKLSNIFQLEITNVSERLSNLIFPRKRRVNMLYVFCGKKPFDVILTLRQIVLFEDGKAQNRRKSRKSSSKMSNSVKKYQKVSESVKKDQKISKY